MRNDHNWVKVEYGVDGVVISSMTRPLNFDDTPSLWTGEMVAWLKALLSAREIRRNLAGKQTYTIAEVVDAVVEALKRRRGDL